MECKKCHENMIESCRIPQLYQRLNCPKCNSQYIEYWNKSFSPKVQYEIEEHNIIERTAEVNIFEDILIRQDWERGIHKRIIHNGKISEIIHYNSSIQSVPFGRRVCHIICPHKVHDNLQMLVQAKGSSFEYTCKDCDFYKECMKRLNDKDKLSKFIKKTYKKIKKNQDKENKKGIRLGNKLSKELNKKPRKSLADVFLEFIRYKEDENETL